jgi:hypothetical protein
MFFAKIQVVVCIIGNQFVLQAKFFVVGDCYLYSVYKHVMENGIIL